MSILDKYKVDVPEGRDGDWAITRFIVKREDADFHNLREMMNGNGGRDVHPGKYTALFEKGNLIMSDVAAEVRDHYDAIHAATGRCLVNGLGLGMVARAMLLKDDVTHVTVVEIQPEVIRLVGPWLRKLGGDRVTIIEADAMARKPAPGERYDVAWHDIWPSISSDNLPEMATLHRRWARRVDWQGSWCQWECRAARRREQRDPWRWRTG